MKKFLLTLIVVIAEGVFYSLYAQSFTVTGTVVDMNDEAMPGVNIVEQGTRGNGAISDINGRFKITVSSSKSVLVFSFIGYENQEVLVGKQRKLDVKMVESGEFGRSCCSRLWLTEESFRSGGYFHGRC